MDARIPARLEVAGLVRAVQAEGGFATVIARGDADAGTILLVLLEKGAEPRLFERMPLLNGARTWTRVRPEIEDYQAVAEFLDRRRIQDPDLWIVELDIPQAERFIV